MHDQTSSTGRSPSLSFTSNEGASSNGDSSIGTKRTPVSSHTITNMGTIEKPTLKKFALKTTPTTHSFATYTHSPHQKFYQPYIPPMANTKKILVYHQTVSQ